MKFQADDEPERHAEHDRDDEPKRDAEQRCDEIVIHSSLLDLLDEAANDLKRRRDEPCRKQIEPAAKRPDQDTERRKYEGKKSPLGKSKHEVNQVSREIVQKIFPTTKCTLPFQVS